MNKDSSPPKEVEQLMEVRPIFPIKIGGMHKYYKDKGELTSFEHPEYGTIETTQFALDCSFKFFTEKIMNGIIAIREKYNKPKVQKKDFTPIKQGKDDEFQRTCTIATATNIVRALIPDSSTKEEDLLTDINPDDFTEDGGLILSIAFDILSKNYPIDEIQIDRYNPADLIEALDNGCIFQASWEQHARIISGYYIDNSGNIFLIINDPLPDRPTQYAVNLAELYTIHLSWDNLSINGFKKRDNKV